MGKQASLLVWIYLLFFTPLYAYENSASLIVGTSYGKIAGNIEQGARHFNGIPYARAPVGKMRWQPPATPQFWQGIKQATDYGPDCPQRQVDGITNGGRTSEDCLTLNIATPLHISGKSKLPVLVWIHGGGLVAGSGNSPVFNNRVWTDENIIFVSLNYRLGALGFFAHPALDQPQGVNYGLMDMIAALKWIKNNIEGFGGDSEQLTIMGVSAGGMAVQLLMVSPAAKGLFNGAISQSGYGTWPKPRTSSVVPLNGSPSAEQIAMDITGDIAGNFDKKQLLNISADELVNAIEGFHLPIVDGITLPEESALMFARGQQHSVPFMSGANSFDGSVFPYSRLSQQSVLAHVGNRQKEMRELYKEDYKISEFQGISRLFGDMRYVVASYYMTRQMEKVDQAGYLYLFNHMPSEKPLNWLGSSHAQAAITLFTSTENIATDMRRYWANFIKTGSPNDKNLLHWPKQKAPQNRWMLFGAKPVVEGDILKEKIDFLQKLYLKRASGLDNLDFH